jgi:hypothetical protein
MRRTGPRPIQRWSLGPGCDSIHSRAMLIATARRRSKTRGDPFCASSIGAQSRGIRPREVRCQRKGLRGKGEGATTMLWEMAAAPPPTPPFLVSGTIPLVAQAPGQVRSRLGTGATATPAR